jgi:hypothetical protein
MAALMIAPPAPSSAQTDLTVGHVPFLTLRNLTGDADPDTMFGDERSGLSAGVCGVRELDLQGLAPLADAAPSFLREEFLRVETVEPAAPMAIYDALQDGEAPLRLHVPLPLQPLPPHLEGPLIFKPTRALRPFRSRGAGP